MQNHPPDKNNPSNPLVKVAALTIDKEYLQFAPRSAVKVLLTLNFKRSSDLRGRAKTVNGEGGTVTFSLALKRASLELAFSFERAPSDVVKIEKVAYLSTLHTKDRVSDVVVTELEAKNNKNLSLGVGAKVASSGAGASAQAGGKIEIGSRSKTTNKRRASRLLSRSNLSATVGGNIVHWEINPNMAANAELEGDSWLDGEVFKASTGKLIDACLATWDQDEKRGVPVITASVFVSMADLIVDNVKVLTDLGEEIPMKHFDTGSGLASKYNPLVQSQVKERFVKQVIRKHLVSQGMAVEGARVQISRASV
jgi:hypothetical protein